METLPYLALEKIVEQLTPQNLAHCSAVCRGWRDVFNQDWIWKPHCDPELEEPLRTIPSVATPVFVTPELEDSTLSPLCHWRLVYMRETHLWNNWGLKNIMEDSENSFKLKNEKDDIIGGDFFTDTLIVVWHRNYIEIFDVSEKSCICKAKTEGVVNIKCGNNCLVIEGKMLLVEKICSVEVYSVDLTNKLISLKHLIDLAKFGAVVPGCKGLVKTHFYIFGDNRRSMLTVFDLNTGEILKEVPYPVMSNINETVRVSMMRSSETSAFIAVVLEVKQREFTFLYETRRPLFVFSIEHHTFLQDLEVKGSYPFLNHNWLALTGYYRLLTVYNLQTKEVILSRKFNNDFTLEVWNDCFIILEVNGQLRETHLIKFSPEQNTWTTVFEYGYQPDIYSSLEIVNKKALVVYIYEGEHLWNLSVEKMVVCKFHWFSHPNFTNKVNQSFTKILSRGFSGEILVYHSW